MPQKENRVGRFERPQHNSGLRTWFFAVSTRCTGESSNEKQVAVIFPAIGGLTALLDE